MVNGQITGAVQPVRCEDGLPTWERLAQITEAHSSAGSRVSLAQCNQA